MYCQERRTLARLSLLRTFHLETLDLMLPDRINTKQNINAIEKKAESNNKLLKIRLMSVNECSEE